MAELRAAALTSAMVRLSAVTDRAAAALGDLLESGDPAITIKAIEMVFKASLSIIEQAQSCQREVVKLHDPNRERRERIDLQREQDILDLMDPPKPEPYKPSPPSIAGGEELLWEIFEGCREIGLDAAPFGKDERECLTLVGVTEFEALTVTGAKALLDAL